MNQKNNEPCWWLLVDKVYLFINTFFAICKFSICTITQNTMPQD